MTPLEAVARAAFDVSLRGAACGLAALALSAALRRRLPPRWHHALWVAVLLRFALPLTPAAPFAWPPEPRAEVPAAVRAADSGLILTTQEFAASDVPVPVPAAVATVSPPVSAVAEPVEWGWWLAAGWLTGVGLLAARRLRQQLALRRQRRGWPSATDPVLVALFDGCRAELGLGRVRLLVSADGSGPAALGVLRAAVVIPAGLAENLPPAELRLVFLHELMHVRRRDALVDLAATLVVCVHWCNPFAWLTLGRLRREREPACDAAVLRLTDEPRRYGHALLAVAGWPGPSGPVFGAAGMFGKDHSLTRRIEMIASYRAPSATRAALGALLLLAFAAVGLTKPADPPATKPAESKSPAPVKPGATLTLGGVCKDADGKPLAGVRVAVYPSTTQNRFEPGAPHRSETAADGRYEVAGLPTPPWAEQSGVNYMIVASKSGLGTAFTFYGDVQSYDKLGLTLRPAATLRGRVTNPAGKPIAGVKVWSLPLAEPLDGVLSATTDAAGQYAITDENAPAAGASRPTVFVQVFHPEYGREAITYPTLPETADIVLKPAGVIEGVVIDAVTGKPAANVAVEYEGVGEHYAQGSTQTDAAGRYRLGSLRAGGYAVHAKAADRTCVALSTLTVSAGRVTASPELKLVAGGVIDGRVVWAQSGKPYDGSKDRLMVTSSGSPRPERPRFGNSAQVGGDGRFRLRVPPGKTTLDLGIALGRYLVENQAEFAGGIEVRDGHTVEVVFRLKTNPRPAMGAIPSAGKVSEKPITLPLPVEAERRAAQQVRDAGGWYELDADQHVSKVNMVYHEPKGGERLANNNTTSDAGLRAVAGFPRLKGLYLHGGQATDAAMPAVAGLTGLEAFIVWNPTKLTAKGVESLAGLPKLRSVSFSQGNLGDDVLSALGRNPSIETLSLQGNAFTDDGLKHLAGLKTLKSLWVGMNKTPLTGDGLKHLAGLTSLQMLDFQQSAVTDAGAAHLKGLPNLKTLYIQSADGTAALTDECVEALSGLTKLETLSVYGCRLSDDGVRKLLKLPALKSLNVTSSAITPEQIAALKKAKPGAKVSVSGLKD